MPVLEVQQWIIFSVIIVFVVVPVVQIIIHRHFLFSTYTLATTICYWNLSFSFKKKVKFSIKLMIQYQLAITNLQRQREKYRKKIYTNQKSLARQ